jgi:hypothetical protein
VGESAEVSVESTDAWLESLQSLLGVMSHAMYTVKTRWGYSSTCFLIEPWHIKENLAMAEDIPKTDSLCYCVLIVMEVTSVDCDWEIPKTKCFKNIKKLPSKYHANGKAWMMTEIFCLFLLSLNAQMGGAKQTNDYFCRQLCSACQRYILC